MIIDVGGMAIAMPPCVRAGTPPGLPHCGGEPAEKAQGRAARSPTSALGTLGDLSDAEGRTGVFLENT